MVLPQPTLWLPFSFNPLSAGSLRFLSSNLFSLCVVLCGFICFPESTIIHFFVLRNLYLQREEALWVPDPCIHLPPEHSDLIAQLHLFQTTCFPPNQLFPPELWKTWKSFLTPPSPLLLWHPGNHDLLRITESWSYNNPSHRFFSLQPFFFSPGLLWQPLPNCSCSLISPPHWIQRTLLKNKEENKTTPLLTALRCLPISWVVSPPKAVVILSPGTAECSLLGEWSS